MIYSKAYRIAVIAMGRRYERGGSEKGRWRWIAHDDALAAHLLAELIMEVR